MPSYSLGEIMSQATARVGRRADIETSVASFWANAAYFEVATAAPHALLERIAVSSTTSSEPRISLPSDFGEPISFALIARSSASSTELSYSTLAVVDHSYIDVNGPGSGQPDRLALFNTYLELWPSPNSAYSVQIRYKSMVTDLTATSDLPSLSTPWRHAVLLKTETHLHEFLGNDAGAHASEMRYLNYVSRLDTDEAKRQKAQGRQGVTVYTGAPE